MKLAVSFRMAAAENRTVGVGWKKNIKPTAKVQL